MQAAVSAFCITLEELVLLQREADVTAVRMDDMRRPWYRNRYHLNSLIAALLVALLVALLAACGQSPTGLPESDADVQTPTEPIVWNSQAIGYEAEAPGALELESLDAEVEILAGGRDIWGTSDEFYYTFTELVGDGSLTVHLNELTADDEWSKAGVMLREGLDADAVNALIHISRSNGAVFQARQTKGGTTVNSAGAQPTASAPSWIKLSRVGDVVVGELSEDGEAWEQVGRYEIPFSEEVYIGMAVTSHSAASTARARFSDIDLDPAGPDLGPSIPGQGPEPQPQPQPEPDPTPSGPQAPSPSFDLPPATLYVATNGNDSNTGRSESDPLRTLARAASIVQPGDVVYIRGGVYPVQVRFTASGTASQPIVWASYPGEWAVLDGSGLAKGQATDRMTVASARYNVFANFEVRNSPQIGVHLSNASDNLLTGMVIHSNHGAGIMNHFGSRNVFEFLTVYNNFDEFNPRGESGEDADGISISSGDSNVVRHVLVYGNSDDGIDAWKSTNTLVEYAISHSNGRGTHGNGSGFKAGGGVDNYTIIRNSIAFNNRSVGFSNNSGRHITFVNNTAFGNQGAAFHAHHSTVQFINNLSIGGTIMVEGSDSRNNSWNLGISDARVASTDPASSNFLSLTSNSPAIEAGIYAGYPHEGSAPDLGALDYGSRIVHLLGEGHAPLANTALAGR